MPEKNTSVRVTFDTLFAHLPLIATNVVALSFITFFGCITGLFSVFAEMTKYDLLVVPHTNGSYVTPDNSEGQLERVGLWYDESDAQGLYTGVPGFVVGNFVIAAGSFLFTSILINGPISGYESLKRALLDNKRRLGFSLVCLPLCTSFIWLIRGVLFFQGAALDELVNNLYMLGILLYLVGVFKSTYDYVVILKAGSSTRERLSVMFNLAGPSVVSASAAAIIFPRMVMPVYSDPDTSDFMRGLLTTTLPSIAFFTFYTWQRLGSKSIATKYGDLIKNPKYTCIPLIFISIFWSRVLISGNVPTSAQAGYSVSKRIPLLATATLASFIQCVARRTEVWRDSWVERIVLGGCGTVSGASSKIAPSDEEVAIKRTQSTKTMDSIGYLLVIDCVFEFTMILWFPALVAFVEIAVMDANAGEAILACVVNILIQLIPELFFTLIIFHLMGIRRDRVENEITIIGKWITLGNLTAVGGAVALAMYGIAGNMLRGDV